MGSLRTRAGKKRSIEQSGKTDQPSLGVPAAGVAAALKALRAHLGESQQAFSNRLGVSVRTVARWESESALPMGVLLRVKRIAQECGRKDLAGDLMLHGLTRLAAQVTEFKLGDLAKTHEWLLTLLGPEYEGKIMGVQRTAIRKVLKERRIPLRPDEREFLGSIAEGIS